MRFFLAVLLLGGLSASQARSWQPDLGPYPWLYLRGGEALESGEKVVALVAVGDVMLGRSGKGLALDGSPFANSAAWLQSADLALANLEGVFATEGQPLPLSGGEALVFPQEAARQLQAAGFDLLGLANNHALDLGCAGLEHTQAVLAAAGILPLGVLAPGESASEARYLERKGLRLAFLAFNTVPRPEGAAGSDTWRSAGWDAAPALAAVRQASEQADAVIVSIHWGFEYQLHRDAAQEQLARQLVEAGANVVLGHHPHVVQGTRLLLRPAAQEVAFVAYSLGNFVFDQMQAETRLGLALRIFIDSQGLRAVQALPLHAGPQPRLVAPQPALEGLERLQPQLPSLAYACRPQDCTLIGEAPSADGIFTAGAIDLTGDGQPERVKLEQERVSVYHGQQLAWQSPPEWRVHDLALGDPDDDGRFDLLLALQKQDATGAWRSQPFIIGYRGGIYRQVWGGSPVSEPLREIELADVDGDGLEELLVLDDVPGSAQQTLLGLDEVPGSAQQTLGMWDWNGWGFSLAWRSPAGHYQDLVSGPAGFSVQYLP